MNRGRILLFGGETMRGGPWPCRSSARALPPSRTCSASCSLPARRGCCTASPVGSRARLIASLRRSKREGHCPAVHHPGLVPPIGRGRGLLRAPLPPRPPAIRLSRTRARINPTMWSSFPLVTRTFSACQKHLPAFQRILSFHDQQLNATFIT